MLVQVLATPSPSPSGDALAKACMTLVACAQNQPALWKALHRVGRPWVLWLEPQGPSLRAVGAAEAGVQVSALWTHEAAGGLDGAQAPSPGGQTWAYGPGSQHLGPRPGDAWVTEES